MNAYDEDAANLLVLTYQPSDAGTGKLEVSASANGFRGTSAAYFDTAELIAFAEELSAFPLPEERPPTIRSGFGSDADHLEQEHIAITVRPVSGKGQVGIQVHLATPRWPDTRADSAHEVRLELLTTYERLRWFSAHLRAVVEGKMTEAMLGGERLE